MTSEGDVTSYFDEMRGHGDGVRDPYAEIGEWLSSQRLEDLKRKGIEAETIFRRVGITFNVYGEKEAAERLIPFDIIPRVIAASEWRRLAAGIEQEIIVTSSQKRATTSTIARRS